MYSTGYDEKSADYYNELYANGYNTSGYNALYQAVISMLKNYTNPRILELGCGLGDLGHLITSEGYSYRGFDFSEEGIKRCKKRFPESKFSLGNVYNSEDYKPVDYNVIIALEILEHVDDLKVLENIPPGVRIIVSVPDYYDSAHLRIYKDPQKDIVERFNSLLHIVQVLSASVNNEKATSKHTIHIFQGIKLIV